MALSVWHCWGVMETQVALIVAFSSSALLGLTYRIFLFTIPHRFSMGLRSSEFAGQLRTGIPWSLNQVLVALALFAGAKSYWKIKSISIKMDMSFNCRIPHSPTESYQTHILTRIWQSMTTSGYPSPPVNNFWGFSSFLTLGPFLDWCVLLFRVMLLVTLKAVSSCSVSFVRRSDGCTLC